MIETLKMKSKASCDEKSRRKTGARLLVTVGSTSF